MLNLDDCLKVGTEAALGAGRLLLERFRDGFRISHKGIIDLVTDADVAAEELIVGRIQTSFPFHSILAEEKHNNRREGGINWIIDPLDGTTNYAHGYEVFSVSIGLEVEGELELGVVCFPVRNELYTVRRGHGAFCNDVPLAVSKTPELSASLLATGFPYDIRTSEQTNLDNFCAFALRTQGVRRSGSAAIDFCHVAAGRLDGFWELKLNPWDCAAGYLMVREAGGKVTSFRGRPGSIYDREVIASNGLIHDQMINVLTNDDLRLTIESIRKS
jgi:myo-inositol-1(or 4)-monophosphatase